VLLDGGDNVAYLVIPALLLTNCYERWAFHTRLGNRVGRLLRDKLGSLDSALHNLGVIYIGTQILLVYMVSGLYKVQGKLWQDGTALYYILRVPEFTFPGISQWVYGNDVLVFVGTYSAIFLLIYCPLAVAVPWLREWAACSMVLFHLSIAILMGLSGFALTMVACDLLFMESALNRIPGYVRGISSALLTRRRQKPLALAMSHVGTSRPVGDTQVSAPTDGDVGVM
jgi:hypothetical protein